MSQDAVARYRAQVIERAINVEWIINGIICQHYFGRVLKGFVLDVLYDEYFSFALKRRILDKIVQLDPKKLQEINRLNTIRNYFAHCAQEIIEGPDPQAGHPRVPDPRQPQRSIDFEALHREFMSLVGGVEEYLAKVFIGLGGVMVPDKPASGRPSPAA